MLIEAGELRTSNAVERLFAVSESRWMLVLVFYGDDSGSHSQKSPCFVVAGYLGLRENWVTFESDWKAALHGPPRIDYFKMRECYHRDGQFQGWAREEADAKLAQLVGILNHYSGVFGELSSVMDWDTFNDAITGPVRDVFHSPYFFCMHGVVKQAIDLVKFASESDKRITFVFDHQSNLEHDAAKQFYYVKATLPSEMSDLMGTISFDDDKQFCPLQAADLIAWQIRRLRAAVKVDEGKLRPELVSLRERLHVGQLVVWRKDGLAEFVAGIEAKLRAFQNPPSAGL